MDTHPASASVLEQACGALVNLSFSEDSRGTLSSSEGLYMVYAAMEACPDSAGLQGYACGILKNVVADDAEATRAAVVASNG
jgi:hypothetical protein